MSLSEWLDTRSDAEEKAGAEMFLGRPDRWYEKGLWRCIGGHVSTWFVKSEVRGDICCACHKSVRLTFPEDVDGPMTP